MATLVVYLAGIVGGGLHHHHAGSGQRAGDEILGQRADHPGIWAAGCDDDEDGCAVCAAIHQAKAPPLATAALTHCTLRADVVTATPPEPPFPFQATTRARGPPLIKSPLA
jgi:hypothetical protein